MPATERKEGEKGEEEGKEREEKKSKRERKNKRDERHGRGESGGEERKEVGFKQGRGDVRECAEESSENA